MVNFEKLALASILEEKADVNQYKLTDFSSYTAKFVAKVIKKYWDKYNKAPTKEVLISAISNQISEEKANIYNGYIKGLPTDIKEDTKIILDGLRESSAIKTLDSKIEELVELAQNREIGDAKSVLNELLVALTDTETNAEDAKDIEFSVDNIKSVDCFLDDVENKLQGLTLISGSSGGGKSIFAMNQALYSYEEGYDILYLNLEMGKNEQMARMLSKVTNIPFSKIYTDLDDKSLKILNQKREEYFSKPNKFKLINSSIDAETIKNTIKSEAKTGLDVVVIDYLQIVKNDTSGEKWRFLENFVQELHRLSLDLGVVIVTPIQVNTSDVKEKNGELSVTPRGSKELEFSSSLFFHILQSQDDTQDKMCRLFTVKSRQSAKKVYILETDFEHMRFKSTGLSM